LDARYRVIAVSEGALGTILAGASKLSAKKDGISNESIWRRRLEYGFYGY